MSRAPENTTNAPHAAQVPAPNHDAEQLAEVADAAREQVETTVRRYPYAAVAAGLGAGVVLGGGIPNWALRMLAGGATRLVVAEAVRRLTTPESTGQPARQPRESHG